MAKDQSLQQLQQPADIKDVLAAQEKDFDCLPCRLMGSAAFTGLGIYTYASGMKQLREREREIMRNSNRLTLGARKGMIYAMSAGLVGLGVYRLRN
ncbi:hypothetical protein D0862_13420 [Hortaea werneckii]|uniref:Distal membrane-arm assembly complex protein 1-like domain-containing protein n=1 Tax=Hortaea werneckii TaxID=91943 RepID=A0A3M7ENL6_HORWE|nr:hypothetical protein D0862_13420 [Hortaea werneckii]